MTTNPQLSVAAQARRRVLASQAQSDAAIAAENIRLRDLVARLTKSADTENPAQPVPEPPTAPVTTSTDEAREEPTTIDVESQGGSVETSEPTDTSVETPGGVAETTQPTETDVEAPVAGTQEVDPAADLTNEMEVQNRDGDLGQPFLTGDWLNTSAGRQWLSTSAGRQLKARIASQVRDRIWASMHLARLRISAGIADLSDPLELARRIEASEVTMPQIQTEVATLTAVARRQPQRPAPMQQRRASAPSLAADSRPSMGGLGASAVMADDIALFE